MRSHELPVLKHNLWLIWLSGSDGHRVAQDAVNQWNILCGVDKWLNLQDATERSMQVALQ